jgi:hypothetical protein
MADDNDDFLEDGEEIEEIDEHELEVSASSRPISWRRVEMFKEKMRLKQQIDDFNSWNI